MRGRGRGFLGQALFRSVKSTQRRQDLSFFGTMTKLASPSGCLISLMNPASNSLASSSPIACLLGSQNRRSDCLTGLNPLIMLRLCSASLRGIPGISEGCQANISQFSRRKARNALSASRSSCAPIDAVLLGSVGCTWSFIISSNGLKEVDFDLLARITSSMSTVDRKVVNSLAARALDNASKAKDVVNVITPLGPGIL